MEALLSGMSNLFAWPTLLIPIAGTLMAMVTSFLPGVGSASLTALVLALTLHWDQESILLLFGALTGGATFMGSITAILFNIPGGASSTPTLLDGYPLAQQGYPRTAIACAATASAIGSIFGVVLLVAVLPLIRPFLLEFGPLERLLVGIWGLMTIISIPTTSPLKACFMTTLGLVVAMIGVDPANGLPRWDFGSLALSRGVGVIPVLLGVFTISELISWMRTVHLKESVLHETAPDDSIRKGIASVLSFPGLVLRSSTIGCLVGMIPGVGGTVAGFVAYGQSVQSARGDRSRFGKGDIRGLIAPEAAVDAKDGGSLLPALAFGLPGSEAGVMLLAAFAVHGVVPGIPMLSSQLQLTFTLIAALLFSNILTSLLGIAATPFLSRLRNLRLDLLALPCLFVSVLAVVQLESQLVDVYIAIGFGIIGYFWRMYDWPRVPFVIAFVLGSLIETNLVLTVQLVQFDRIIPHERIASVILFAMIVGSIFWLRTKRNRVEQSLKQIIADVLIGLGTLLIVGIFTIIALQGGVAYSWYAKTLIMLCFMVGLLVVFLNLIPLRRMLSNATTININELMQNFIVLPQGHRLPLVLTLLLGIFCWLAGLFVAMGLVTSVWCMKGSSKNIFAILQSVAMGFLVGSSMYIFITNFTNLVLPPSLLESFFNN